MRFKKGDRVVVVDEKLAYITTSAVVKNGDIGTVGIWEVGDYEVLIDGDLSGIPWWIPQKAVELLVEKR